jgi:folylpolyglutamate synthase/dihydropteroate synthase
MVQKLADIKNATYIITDVPNQERKLDNKILFEEFAKFIPSPNITISNNNITALETCMKHYKDGDLILITGSLYLISSIRKHIQDIKGDI